MPFTPKKFADRLENNGGGSVRDHYLSPSKVKADGSLRFAMVSDEDPLWFYECWGEDSAGNSRPFRFADDPTPAEIEQEMGADYTRRMNREATAPEPVKMALAFPIYNFEMERIQTLQITQKGLQKELTKISQMDDYENLTEWDFVMTKEATVSPDMYGLRPAPRKKGAQEAIDAAWNEAKDNGYDLNRLLVGGHPHKAD